MKHRHVISNWIYQRNLKPFVEQIAALAEYAFDDHDWVTIEYGVRDTDANMDKWFDYPFLGQRPLHLEIAADGVSNADEVLVRVGSDDDFTPEQKACLDMLIELCQRYTLS